MTSRVFTSITRTQHTRSSLWLRIEELVRKRNAIAHGDGSAEATKGDVRAYQTAARVFCDRADRLLSRQLASLCDVAQPW